VTSSARQRLLGPALGLTAGALALALWLGGALDRAEHLTWDWRVRQAAAPSAASGDIALVLLDQSSLDWGAETAGWSWPWPREVYGALLGFCRRAGARTVTMDVLFTEPSLYGVWDDQALAEALTAAGDVAVACFVDTAGAVTRPVPEIAAAAAVLGDASGAPDADGVVRRARLGRRTTDGATAPSLGAAAYLLAGGVAGDLPAGAPVLAYAPAGTYRAFSAAAVIQSELRLQEGGEPVVDPAGLRDAHVLFGFSAPGLLDQRATPLARVNPGVVVHATVLDNLLTGGFIRPAPAATVAVFVLLLGALAGAAAVRTGRAWLAVLVLVGAVALPVAMGLILYGARLWWPVAPAVLAGVGGWAGGVVVNWATEGRQRRFLRQAFRHYLSPAVVDRLVQDPGRLQLGGERRELTIFFSDLAGFTSLGERLRPEDLTALLNDYLSAMTDIVLEEGGTLDKYEGDAIIAFWNAPLDVPDHAARACRAAVRCQRELARRRDEWRARCGQDLAMRVGLHTGDVIVGNLGSRQRFDYSILGDAANLASRLEGVNKVFGTGILASAATRRAAGQAVTARELGDVAVVGRTEPVTVFELGGLGGEDEPAAWSLYGRALAEARAGRGQAAAGLLTGAGDDPAAAALGRQLAEDPTFAGCWRLTSK
jgi:adenylate cyclase